MYVFTDNGQGSTYTRNKQQGIRPYQQRENSRIPKGKSKIPKSDERSYFKLLAPILETLNATSVFRQNRISKGQATAIHLFKDVCHCQNIPLALKDHQLRLYLCKLYNLNYTSTTITCHWHPIYDILMYNNIPISDEIMNLFIFIKEQARPRIDKKLPVLHTLLNQQLAALDLFFIGYENLLAKVTLATAWAAQLHVSEYSSSLVADIRAGDDPNLRRDNVLVQTDRLTVIFISDKTSLQCKECFIPWENVPIDNFKEILQYYIQSAT